MGWRRGWESGAPGEQVGGVSVIDRWERELVDRCESLINRWEQPAQNAAPWLRRDEQTLRQWKDKFTVALTRLRQLKAS